MNQFAQNNSRRGVLFGLAAVMVGGLGCATALTMSNTSKTTTKEGDVVLSEIIVALGRPDEALAKQINNSHAVVFFGKNNTYLLIDGGERLLEFSQKLDSKRINLIADSKLLYLKDKKVWGTLEFTYTLAPGESLSENEKITLTKLGFHSQGTGYVASVHVEGAVYPATTLSDVGLAHLSQSRDLIFHAPPRTEWTPNFGSVAFLPIAIVVDIVTAPIQLLGFVVVAVSAGRH